MKKYNFVLVHACLVWVWRVPIYHHIIGELRGLMGIQKLLSQLLKCHVSVPSTFLTLTPSLSFYTWISFHPTTPLCGSYFSHHALPSIIYIFFLKHIFFPFLLTGYLYLIFLYDSFFFKIM